GIDAVGLGPAHAAVHGHAGGLHDRHLDAALLQPAREPEPAPAGLVGDDHSVYRHASSGGAALVALDCRHERVGAGGDNPAAAADLDSEDQRAVVVQPVAGGKVGLLGHGGAPGDGGA